MTDHPTGPWRARGERSLPSALINEIARQIDLPVAAEAAVLVDALRARFGDSLAGVLVYGSQLHDGDLTTGLVDLYALVDSYQAAYPGRMLRLGNAMLGPNVFYLEAGSHDPPLKAKYAVMSLGQFERGCARWFHSYLWARFAQPARLVYSRDEVSTGRIRQSLATAVMRFLTETAPALEPGPVDASTIWTVGLDLAYASELRTERHRAQVLTRVNRREFEQLTAVAVAGLVPLLNATENGRYRSDANSSQRRRARLRWGIRRWQGRVLSVLRLTKAVFTFDRGVDYIALKIERHTGVVVAVTPALRRNPLLFGPKVLWRLLRQGTVR